MNRLIHPAEFVFPGHPDKVCDAIADSIVEEARRRERRALVGVEVAAHRRGVHVTGRVACEGAAGIDVDSIVRDTFRTAGYGPEWGPAPEDLQVTANLCLGSLVDGESEFRVISDDQSICTGYANDLAATNHQPVEQWLVRRIARRLHALRAQHPELALGPDGKVCISVQEALACGEDSELGQRGSVPCRWSLLHFNCSLQQRIGADDIALQRAVRAALQHELSAAAHDLPGLSPSMPSAVTVNGAGAFEVGGTEGDNGLAGKKLVVDAYGPRVPIGGGALSGKDFFKADRAGGMHARRLARLAVQLGLASEVTVTLGWFPGDRVARVLDAVDGRGRVLDLERLALNMDLTLRRSGETFSVPGLVEVARWGHFADPNLPWERRLTL